jgi:hypothetical protein
MCFSSNFSNIYHFSRVFYYLLLLGNRVLDRQYLLYFSLVNLEDKIERFIY